MVYIKKFNQIMFLSEIIRLRKSIIKLVKFKRIKNFFSLQLFKYFGVTNPFPFSIIIDPTSVCNLKCPMCPKTQVTTNIPEGFMDFENFKKIINEIKDHTFLIILCNNGEPLLHKNITGMIKYAHKNNILTYISTHLSFNDDKKIKELAHSELDFITIALDGATKKTYQKYRKGGDFNQVIKNIQTLVKERKNNLPIIELQFIVMKENEHEIEKIKKLAKKLKIDRLILKTAYIEKDTQKFLPNNKLYRLQFKKNPKCLHSFYRSVIAWNGLIFPCCSIKRGLNKEYSLGNVFEKGFKNIWLSKEYKTFRKMAFKKSNNLKACKKCLMNDIVKNRVILKV